MRHGSIQSRPMPTSYMPYEPTQDLLLPPSLHEWLPQDHLAHFIADTIDQLELSAFYKRYEDGGPRNQPFHPAMMVNVLVYGYASGVFSSRKIQIIQIPTKMGNRPSLASVLSATQPYAVTLGHRAVQQSRREQGCESTSRFQ